MSSTIPPIDQALLPASVRNGTAERKEQYQSALEFERVLVGQLTAQLMKSSGSDDAPAAVKAMRENLPSALSDALMGAGGIGLAAQLDASWNPVTTTATTSTSLSGAAGTAQAAEGGVSA